MLLSNVGVSPAVRGVVCAPRAAAATPGVILLTGSSGWNTTYAEIASWLAEAGFTALALDYLAETGCEPSPEEEARHWPAWEATVRNAVAFLQEGHRQRRRVGLVGYSLGAYLAVSVASDLPDVKAVVDFFGGGGRGSKSLEDQVRNLPSLLILHGDRDSVVPVASGYQLRDAALAQGRHVKMHVYPGAEHGFNAPWSPNFSQQESPDSLARTILFLGDWLRA
jgi:carboxymethylenebutenolidase